LNLQDQSARAILNLFASCLDELKRRGVTRSTNNPVADYSEFLFQNALGLTLCPKSTKGYDATDMSGKKYEIKGRRVTPHNKSRQLSAIRGLPEHHFDYLAGIDFAHDFSVLKACLIPHDEVGALSAYIAHTNTWILNLRDTVWEREGVVDVTAKLQKAQYAHDAEQTDAASRDR
jgi:hypothetical protein